MAGKKRFRRPNVEKPKDNEAIPDRLGIGVREWRDNTGQLVIYIQEQPAFYIVLGKYAETRIPNSTPYYVADYTHAPVISGGVSRHEHLLLAIAKVHELVEDFKRRKANAHIYD